MNQSKNDYVAQLKSAWEVAILNKKTMSHVASDKNKTIYAYMILGAAAVLSLIGSQLFPGWFAPSLGMSIGMAVTQFITLIAVIYLVSIIAKSIFKGVANHDAFFRVMSYGLIVYWINIIPNLGIISFIWGIVIAVIILKTIHKLTTGGIIGTLLLGFIGMLLIGMVFGSVMAAIGLGGGYGYQMKDFDGFKMNVGGDDVMMDFNEDGDFKMDVETDDGEGMMRMEDGKMEITLPGGETMKIDVNE